MEVFADGVYEYGCVSAQSLRAEKRRWIWRVFADFWAGVRLWVGI